jgi:hypothetical protein
VNKPTIRTGHTAIVDTLTTLTSQLTHSDLHHTDIWVGDPENSALIHGQTGLRLAYEARVTPTLLRSPQPLC